MSWDDAVDFTRWLSVNNDKTFRLPSESEWEYAARGGKSTSYWWGNEPIQGTANCRDCGNRLALKKTVPVGSYTPNPYGLYDVSGNVYEWCLDSNQGNYQNAPQNGSAWYGVDTTSRAIRGGSWRHSITDTKTSARCWDNGNERNIDIGFRVILEP